jgi:hypothetical protein
MYQAKGYRRRSVNFSRCLLLDLALSVGSGGHLEYHNMLNDKIDIAEQS